MRQCIVYFINNDMNSSMNEDQLFGIEHRKAFYRERLFPVHLNNELAKYKSIKAINTSYNLRNSLPIYKHTDIWSFTVMDQIEVLHNEELLNRISNWLQDTHNTLTIITDNFNPNGSMITYINDYIKIVTIPELLGLPYIEYQYKQKYTYEKLYNAFMQRIQEDRLHFFVELSKNNLLDQGYVSFLGIFSLNDTHNPINDRQLHVNKLIYNVPNSIPITVPYKNFVEPTGLFTDVEEKCKYSISYETYNNNIITEGYQYNWIIFTEKTLRSLQVPNVSIIANTTGYINVLYKLGFGINPINNGISNITNWNDQALWLTDLLKTDPISSESTEHIRVAKHNTEILKNMSECIETPEFIIKVKELIKN